MRSFCEQLTKAELHLHLEGSIEPETMKELAPHLTLDEIRDRYRFSGFLGFLDCFKWVAGHLNTPADYALVTRHLLQRLAAQNIRYAEITLSAGVILWRGHPFAPIYDAIVEEAARHNVETWWVLDTIRHFGVEAAWPVVRLAAERAENRVVAFGLGGDEARGPASMFADVLAFARDHGLALVPHAGETTSADSVWEAVRHGAIRIGHGIRAVDDPALCAELRSRGIALEICIASNVATGAVPSLEAHPVRRLFEAGVPIVLNTDDPAMFHTTLAHEYELAGALGFSESELQILASNSYRYSLRGCYPRS